MTQIILPGLQYRRLWFCLGLVIALLIAATSLVPARDLPNIGLSDKIEHGISYALLAFWFGSVIVRRDFPGLVVTLVAFGGLIELAQGWMHLGRHADLSDLAADMAGIAVGLALALTPLGRWAHLIESGFRRMRA